MKANWFDKNGWLVISAVIVIGLAAFVAAQTGPAFFGHSSDEIAFVTSNSATTTETNDCTNSDPFDCRAVCPGDPTPNSTYRAFSGNCLSGNGLVWQSMGVTNDFKGWECLDNSHEYGQTFIASVICIEVGI